MVRSVHTLYRLIIILLLLSLTPLVWSTDHYESGDTILAGSEFGYPPYCIVNDEGEADGFSVELMRAALEVMGFEVEFTVDQWDAVKHALEVGEVEALPLVGRTPEREDIFDFTFPYLTMHGAVVVREENHTIHGLEDLAGRDVAVMRGDNAEEFADRSLHDSRIIATDTFAEALQLLSAGGADAVLIQRLVALQLLHDLEIDNLRIAGPPIMEFNQSFSFAVREGDDRLLALLNEGLSLIIANGTYDRLYTKWFGPLQRISRSFDRVIVGGDSSYPPYEYLDANGEPAGFNVDLTRAIAEEIGIEVEIVLDTWSRTYDRLLGGEVDLLQGVFYSLEREEYLDFTQPHSMVSHVIVTRRGEMDELQTMEDLSGQKILVMEDDIMHDRAVELGLADFLIPVESQEIALERLYEGEADCALAAEVPALYWMDKNGWSNLEINARVFSPEYAFAALSTADSDLLMEFSEGLSTLRATGVYREIHNRWFSVYEESDRTGEVFRVLLFVLIPVVITALLVMLWLSTLRRQVRERTKELEQATDELRREVLMKQEAENRIAAERERLHITLRSIGDGVITTDVKGRVELVNRVAEELTGWSQREAQGHPLSEVFRIIHEHTGRACENPVDRVIETGEVVELANHTMLISRTGERFIVADSGAPIRDYRSEIVGVVLVFRDMTEDIRLQEKIQQTTRLDSLGVLAGGIAHDFNNLLSGIFGYVQLAKETAKAGDDPLDYLDEVLAIFGRARDLTQQLLTFSKGGQPKRETMDIGSLIRNSASFALSGSQVGCSYRIDEELWRCDVDEHQISQVLDNIVINAQQAMPTEGEIAISAENVELGEKNPQLLEPGQYVHIAVADTGIGIPAKILDKIFDPFFTTKQRGNGLGLATCYSIMAKHDGTITVDSVQGEGSTFHIYLPRSAGSWIYALAERQSTHFGTGTILVLDDEDFIRTVLGRMLESMGYAATEAENGEQALKLWSEAFSSEKGGFTAALLDLTIPGGAGGREIIDRMREEAPDVPIFASSGYSEDDVMSSPEAYGFTDSIAKPFRRGELQELLKRHLPNRKEGE